MTSQSIQLSQIKVTSDFKRQISQVQRDGSEFYKTITLVQVGRLKGFAQDNEGLRKYQGKICAPASDSLRSRILEEAHRSNFTMHPGISKMYQDLKRIFWWLKMKTDIAELVNKCLVCQKVKIEYQKPSRVLQPFEIPEWKYESILMDFVIGLPRMSTQYGAI